MHVQLQEWHLSLLNSHWFMLRNFFTDVKAVFKTGRKKDKGLKEGEAEVRAAHAATSRSAHARTHTARTRTAREREGEGEGERKGEGERGRGRGMSAHVDTSV